MFTQNNLYDKDIESWHFTLSFNKLVINLLHQTYIFHCYDDNKLLGFNTSLSL